MSSLRAAAVIWVVGAATYLACEGIAAARLPGYRYGADYISDLGVSAIMNVGAFMVHGLLFLLGAVVAHRSGPAAGALGRWFVLAAAANACGNVLVGAFPSGGDSSPWHAIGAGLAIIGGNAAVILGGLASRRFGAPPAYRRLSVAVGVFGILCLVLLVADGAVGARVLPVGVVERGSVYSIIGWELLTGVAILWCTTRRRHPRAPSPRRWR